jgi:site-specific recombinase XerD
LFEGGKESIVKHIINGDVVLSRPPEGPLAAQVAAFAKWASEEGYARYSRYRQVLLAAGFSRWLGQRAIRPRRVSADHPSHYLQFRARRVRRHSGDAAALTQFIDFLRRQRVIRAEKISPAALTPVEQEAQAFECYLRDDRALAQATRVNYIPFIRGFLTDRFGHGPVTLARLNASDVVRFVQRQAPRLQLKRAKLLTSALRSFLQYVRYRGDIALDLAAAVPAVANWSMPSIPRAIPAEQVRQLLASISRRTAIGRRDYAIVLLLARLGLRASEVAFLELDDIDWSTGRVSVRGKGGQRTALPVPADVGAAMVAYLRHGRPRSTSRRVFLRSKAPIRGFLSQCAIGSLVRHALQRAGIDAPTTGAHQFRHALATQMLRQGASLTEIGEVLRHHSPQTTTIYTKVDLNALRPLALPWPGGAR